MFTEKEKVIDSYIEKNRGFITASKLKCFSKSPEEYFIKYVLETPYQTKKKKCLEIGTAVDDYISYGEKKFFEMYYIDEGLTIAGLKESLDSEGIIYNPKAKKDELEGELYGDRSLKKRLTASEGEIVQNVIREFTRQPLMDAEGDYEKQKELTATYKNLKLKGTLDRFMKFDKVDSEGFGGAIRDTKTTGDMLRFPFQAYNDFGYDVSMTFYYLLVNITEGIQSKLILDTIQTTGSFCSRVYDIPQEIIQNVLDNKIMPKLDLLAQMHEIYDKDKDPSIWKVKGNFEDLAKSDIYHLLESTIQDKTEILQ